MSYIDPNSLEIVDLASNISTEIVENLELENSSNETTINLQPDLLPSSTPQHWGQGSVVRLNIKGRIHHSPLSNKSPTHNLMLFNHSLINSNSLQLIVVNP